VFVISGSVMLPLIFINNIKINNMETKQEILEEAALNIIPDKSTAGWIDSFSATERIGFIKGAKWQAERMYSEEDLRYAFECATDLNPSFESFSAWFEQFKKK
jgi:hypothetical protein